VSIVQRDWVLDAIEQLGQALARIASLIADSKHEQALAVIEEAERALLGRQLMTLGRTDTTTAALLLHNPERVRAWALLLAERAYVLGTLGRQPDARVTARRALALYGAAQRKGTRVTEADRDRLERIKPLTLA
jgi:hypothetical protein